VQWREGKLLMLNVILERERKEKKGGSRGASVVRFECEEREGRNFSAAVGVLGAVGQRFRQPFRR